jgi:hypothetical protein
MASQLNARVARSHQSAPLPTDIWPEGFTQHKLNRLLELRAVIGAMRGEREARDPLLAWVRTHERTDLS